MNIISYMSALLLTLIFSWMLVGGKLSYLEEKKIKESVIFPFPEKFNGSNNIKTDFSSSFKLKCSLI